MIDEVRRCFFIRRCRFTPRKLRSVYGWLVELTLKNRFGDIPCGVKYSVSIARPETFVSKVIGSVMLVVLQIW